VRALTSRRAQSYCILVETCYSDLVTMNVKIKKALSDASSTWGVGWLNLTADHRNALVVASLAGQFTGMDPESLTIERRSELLVEWQTLMSEALCTEF
jgi:hypothetical protein